MSTRIRTTDKAYTNCNRLREECRAEDTRAVANRVLHDACFERVVENELSNRRRSFFVEHRQVRDTAAQNDHLRIENVDEGGDGTPKRSKDTGKYGPGVFVGFAALYDLGEESLLSADTGIGGFDCRSR